MKKSICFHISSLGGGGAEKGLVNLINHLEPSRYDSTIIVSFLKLDRCKELTVPVKLQYIHGRGRLAFGKKSLWSKNNQFYHSIYSFQGAFLHRLFGLSTYDVEFLFMDSPNVAFLAANSAHMKTIVRLSTNYENCPINFACCDLPWYKKRHYRLTERCTHIVAPSKEAANAYQRTTGVSHALTTIYNIHDRAELEALAQQGSLCIAKSKFTMVSLGRLNEGKGYSRLLDICKRLADDGLDFELWILGEGPDHDMLCQKKDTLGLSNVHLLGYKDNPYPYLKAADIYVSSSYYEGLSNAAKEALLLGTPSVVADCSGMREIFGKHGEYGLITENDDESLYQGLRKMLSDPVLYAHYQKKTRERQSFFSVEKSLKAFEALF